jgi:hypothetical protein
VRNYSLNARVCLLFFILAAGLSSLRAADPPHQQPAAIQLVEDNARPLPAVVPQFGAWPNCGWLPNFYCVKAPYDCKPYPCTPRGYQTSCDVYCKKPFPCTPAPDCGVGPCYCPKPPVCAFPGNPCPPCNKGK